MADNVLKFLTREAEDQLHGGGEPPYDGDMNARVTALETRLDTILPMLATKGDVAELRADLSGEAGTLRTDMHKGFGDMIKWIVGVAFTGFAVLIAALTYFQAQNRAQQVAPSQQPIIINVPPPVAAPVPQAPQLKR